MIGDGLGFQKSLAHTVAAAVGGGLERAGPATPAHLGCVAGGRLDGRFPGAFVRGIRRGARPLRPRRDVAAGSELSLVSTVRRQLGEAGVGAGPAHGGGAGVGFFCWGASYSLPPRLPGSRRKSQPLLLFPVVFFRAE